MYIMAGDKPVVEYDEAFDFKILDLDLAPLYIKNRGNVKAWIEERAVDPNRPNSRAVKSRQGLSKNAAALETVMKMDAAAITDNFWVKAETRGLQAASEEEPVGGLKQKFDNIRFTYYNTTVKKICFRARCDSSPVVMSLRATSPRAFSAERVRSPYRRYSPDERNTDTFHVFSDFALELIPGFFSDLTDS